MELFCLIFIVICIFIIFGGLDYIDRRNLNLSKEQTTYTSNSDLLSDVEFKVEPEFLVYLVKCKGKNEYFIRVTYASNGAKFLHSETYKNKTFAQKKALKLAIELGTFVKNK